LSLVPFFLLLFWLRKSDQPRVQDGADGGTSPRDDTNGTGTDRKLDGATA